MFFSSKFGIENDKSVFSKKVQYKFVNKLWNDVLAFTLHMILSAPEERLLYYRNEFRK